MQDNSMKGGRLNRKIFLKTSAPESGLIIFVKNNLDV